VESSSVNIRNPGSIRHAEGVKCPESMRCLKSMVDSEIIFAHIQAVGISSAV
jgi:hypothetical protein